MAVHNEWITLKMLLALWNSFRYIQEQALDIRCKAMVKMKKTNHLIKRGKSQGFAGIHIVTGIDIQLNGYLYQINNE